MNQFPTQFFNVTPKFDADLIGCLKTINHKTWAINCKFFYTVFNLSCNTRIGVRAKPYFTTKSRLKAHFYRNMCFQFFFDKLECFHAVKKIDIFLRHHSSEWNAMER